VDPSALSNRLTAHFRQEAAIGESLQDAPPLGVFIARRHRRQSEPVGENIETLRKELNNFVKLHIREQQAFGFGQSGGEPVDCSAITKKVWDTEEKLSAIAESLPQATPMTLIQRGIILQTNAALQNFLVDMSSMTSGGEVDQSEVRLVLRNCIALGQALGELAQGLEAAMLQKKIGAANA
jgi:hypothetical protein